MSSGITDVIRKSTNISSSSLVCDGATSTELQRAAPPGENLDVVLTNVTGSSDFANTSVSSNFINHQPPVTTSSSSSDSSLTNAINIGPNSILLSSSHYASNTSSSIYSSAQENVSLQSSTHTLKNESPLLPQNIHPCQSLFYIPAILCNHCCLHSPNHPSLSMNQFMQHKQANQSHDPPVLCQPIPELPNDSPLKCQPITQITLPSDQSCQQSHHWLLNQFGGLTLGGASQTGLSFPLHLSNTSCSGSHKGHELGSSYNALNTKNTCHCYPPCSCHVQVPDNVQSSVAEAVCIDAHPNVVCSAPTTSPAFKMDSDINCHNQGLTSTSLSGQPVWEESRSSVERQNEHEPYHFHSVSTQTDNHLHHFSRNSAAVIAEKEASSNLAHDDLCNMTSKLIKLQLLSETSTFSDLSLVNAFGRGAYQSSNFNPVAFQHTVGTSKDFPVAYEDTGTSKDLEQSNHDCQSHQTAVQCSNEGTNKEYQKPEEHVSEPCRAKCGKDVPDDHKSLLSVTNMSSEVKSSVGELIQQKSVPEQKQSSLLPHLQCHMPQSPTPSHRLPAAAYNYHGQASTSGWGAVGQRSYQGNASVEDNNDQSIQNPTQAMYGKASQLPHSLVSCNDSKIGNKNVDTKKDVSVSSHACCSTHALPNQTLWFKSPAATAVSGFKDSFITPINDSTSNPSVSKNNDNDNNPSPYIPITRPTTPPPYSTSTHYPTTTFPFSNPSSIHSTVPHNNPSSYQPASQRCHTTNTTFYAREAANSEAASLASMRGAGVSALRNVAATAAVTTTTTTSPSRLDDWIHLNVGGQDFTTSRATLILEEPESMLAKMFGGHHPRMPPASLDPRGRYIIDRPPHYFSPLLNYLRTGVLVLDPDINPEGVLLEARFYGLEGVIPRLEKMVAETNCPASDKPLSRVDVVRALLTTSPTTTLRFQAVNLRGADLSWLDLKCINFKYADLRGANLTGANLSGCNLERAKLSGACLDQAQLLNVRLVCADLQSACMRGCNFENPSGGVLPNCEGVNLRNSNLEGSMMAHVNLRVSTLKNANLRNCDLRMSVLAGADLENCDLSGSNLLNANLRGANLKDASFELMQTPLHMSQTCDL